MPEQSMLATVVPAMIGTGNMNVPLNPRVTISPVNENIGISNGTPSDPQAPDIVNMGMVNSPTFESDPTNENMGRVNIPVEWVAIYFIP